MMHQFSHIFLQYLQIILCVVVLLGASYFDIKERLIPDWVSVLLIFLGSLLFILLGQHLFLIEFVISIIFIAFVGFVLYRFHFWGGGDVKLLIGLSSFLVRFPVLPAIFENPMNQLNPLPIPGAVLLNVMITQLYYLAVTPLLYLVLNYSYRREVFNLMPVIPMRIISLLLISTIVSFFGGLFLQQWFLSGLLFLLITSTGFNLLIPSNIKNWYWKEVFPSNLSYGDTLQTEFIHPEGVIESHPHRLTEEEILIIQETPQELQSSLKIVIWQGIPLAPMFLIAALLSYIWGDLFYLLLQLVF